MPAPVVLLDACVLYPAALRDLLMWLAAGEIIHAKWSEAIHEEWITALLRERPALTRTKLEHTRDLMDAHAGDCLVEGYEALIETLTLPDAGDRHVLAAAIQGGADAIVTWNLRDFPGAVLRQHGLEVWTPDQLVTRLLAEDQGGVISLMRAHRASLKNPSKNADEYLETLADQRLTDSVEIILSLGTEI